MDHQDSPVDASHLVSAKNKTLIQDELLKPSLKSKILKLVTGVIAKSKDCRHKK